MKKVSELLENEIREKEKALPACRILDGIMEGKGHFFWGNGVTYYSVSRKDVLRAIKEMGGEWKKSFNPYTGSLTYSRKVGGLKIELTTGELPPRCKLEKKVEREPAIEETVREVYEIVCGR